MGALFSHLVARLLGDGRPHEGTRERTEKEEDS